MPERAVGIMRLLGGVLAYNAGYAGEALLHTRDEEFVPREGDVILFFDPSALFNLSSGGDEDLETLVTQIGNTIYTRNSSDLDDPHDFEWSRRQCAINITTIIIDAAYHLSRSKIVTMKEFGGSLLAWADTFEWRR
jgi:hypothetical protein